MARKSKGFSELLHQEQDYGQAADKSYKRLRQKVKKTVGKDCSENMVMNPQGVAKMSEILQAFVEPYKETAHDFAEVESLLGLAVLAWNIALIPKKNRQETMDSMLPQLTSEMDQTIKAEMQSLIHELIERKDRYFSDCKRFITSFDLQPQKDSYFLSVAATLEE